MTGHLRIFRGLPGSGKTTAATAEAAAAENGICLGRDEFRDLLAGTDRPGVLAPALEIAVTAALEATAESLLVNGYYVMASSTHLIPAAVAEMVRVAIRAGATWDTVNVCTPIEECIRRDAERGAAGGRMVGAAVIRRMAARSGVQEDGTIPEIPRGMLAAAAGRMESLSMLQRVRDPGRGARTAAIRFARTSGLTVAEVATALGVRPSSVYQAGRTYRPTPRRAGE